LRTAAIDTSIQDFLFIIFSFFEGPGITFLRVYCCVAVYVKFFILFLINIIVEKLPELHLTTMHEFGNKEGLLKCIDSQFVEIINQDMYNIDMTNKLLLLINSVYECTGSNFKGSKTYLFGSRMSGLALQDSDVDLYFSIGNINIIYIRMYM